MPTTAENIEAVGLEVPDVAQISLDDIELNSNVSQSRDIALDQEMVATYGDRILAGHEMPPIIVSRNGNGRARIVSGDHRAHGAVKVGESEIPAYVLTSASPSQLRQLAHLENFNNGLPQRTAERVAAAQRAVELDGMSLSRAARLYAVPAGTLGHNVARKYVEDELDAAGLTAERPSQSIAMHLFRLKDRPSLLVAAARLQQQAALSSAELGALVKQVRQAGSDDDALKLIANEDKKRAPEKAAAVQGTATHPARKSASKAASMFRTSVLDERQTLLEVLGAGDPLVETLTGISRDLGQLVKELRAIQR